MVTPPNREGIVSHNGERPSTGWLTLIARLFLGGVFIYASVDKILHPGDFARAVYNYQILPDGLINLTALALPWLGYCCWRYRLLTNIWLPGAIFGSTVTLGFFLTLLFNHYRGLDVHCGVFHPTGPGHTAAHGLVPVQGSEGHQVASSFVRWKQSPGRLRQAADRHRCNFGQTAHRKLGKSRCLFPALDG